MSTAVTLDPRHVPAALRPALEAVRTAGATQNNLNKQLAVAPMSARPELQEEYDKAAEDGQTALVELTALATELAPEMRAAAANAFAVAVDRARGHIAQAVTELQDAAEAAALHAAIKDGRATLNTLGERAQRHPARNACMGATGYLRDISAGLPESVG